MSDTGNSATQDRAEKLKRLRRGQTVRWLGLIAGMLSIIGFAFFVINMPADIGDLDTQDWIILITLLTLPAVFIGAGYWFGFRCPFCTRGFGSRTYLTPNFCPSCGENLES